MELRFAMRLPEAWRLLRISWKPGRMAGIGLLAISVCLLSVGYIVFSAYLTRDFTLPSLAKLLCVIMLIYQGLLWDVILPAQVSNSLAQEFAVGTWQFQQTTPQPVRRLLLGKLLGAGGDVYLAAGIGLPFLALGVIAGPYPLLNVLGVCLTMLALSALVSSVTLYFAAMAGGRKQGGAVTTVVVLVVLLWMLVGLADYAKTRPGSFAALHPLFIMLAMINPKWASFAFVKFFGFAFPIVPFAVVFYAACAWWIFTATEAQLRRSMTIPMSRTPLFAAFIALEFCLIGFSHAAAGKPWYAAWIPIYISLNLLPLYYVLLNHSLNLSELRPWLYRLRGRKISWPELFRGDAPGVFTVAVLLAIFALGAAAFNLRLHGQDILNWATRSPQLYRLNSAPLIVILLFLPSVVIVLRDALFFQAGQLLFKRGREIAFAAYLILFGALPGLLMVRRFENPVLDLSPLTALLSSVVIRDWKDYQGLYINYLAVNLALLVLLAAINYRLLRKAQQNLPPELVK